MGVQWLSGQGLSVTVVTLIPGPEHYPELVPQAYYVVAQKYFPGASEAGTCTGTVYTPNGTDQIAANVRG